MTICGSAECTACESVDTSAQVYGFPHSDADNRAVSDDNFYFRAEEAPPANVQKDTVSVPLCAQSGSSCACIGAAWQVVAIDASIALEDADNRAREQLKYGQHNVKAAEAALEDIRRILNEAMADYRLVADVLERAESQ